MAKIENPMHLLSTLEHSNKEDKVLHQNSHENGLTFWGIYESVYPLPWKYYIKVNNEKKQMTDSKTYTSPLVVRKISLPKDVS